MLLNVSHNDHEVRRKIEAEVGKPFTIAERLKRGGIGIARLVISEASMQIQNLLILDNNRDICNIEMRPAGILVGFRSKLSSYVLVIPYYKLILYKGKADEYSIYRDNYFIRISVGTREKGTHKFMRKLVSEKATVLPSNPSEPDY